MNGKDIFLGLKYIGDDLVEKAEYARFPSRRRFRRPVLMAAIIALALVLVGCAVAYALSLQGLRLGDRTVTQDVYEYDPNTGEATNYVGQQTYTQQVLTLAGLSGSPASQAAREWYAFCESYDPDRQIQRSVWGNYPQFPAQYAGYGLYTQEMKDKLDELLEKYDLKLRGQPVEFRTTKQLFRALGMETVLLPGSGAQLRFNHSVYYENGNLDLYFTLTLPGEPGAQVNGYLYYRPKDCLIPDTAVLTQASWEEQNYTTAAGAPVLILRAQDASSAWIFCDMERHTASVRLDAVQSLEEPGRFEVLSGEQLERIADCIDFSLEPRLVDGWETLPDDSVPAGQEINGYSIEPISAFTDGYGYRIVLRITAPEGVALTDPQDHTARVEAGAGVYGGCVEDGDGKENTCHFILSESVRPEQRTPDGGFPYPEGQAVSVYWEDLYFTRYDFDRNESVRTLLTEGTWSFQVPLATADTRQVELLSGPITAKGSVGWRMDGTDVLEELEITSVKLRPLSIVLTSENGNADFFRFGGQGSSIVMKDGSWTEFSWYELDAPIDLDQVAYVQLADGTILPMPDMDAQTVAFLAEMIQAQKDAAYVPVPEFTDGVELLTGPITMSHLAGYVTDPTGYMEPLYEYLSITSIILHPKGLAILGPAAFDDPETQATVYYADGTEILLTGIGGSPYCDEPMSQLRSETVIDLAKVERILLPDGTELTMP